MYGNIRQWFPKFSGYGPWEPEYQDVLDRAAFLGYTTPNSSINNRNNNRVKFLKDVGIWNSLDLLYLFDQPTGCDEFAKLNYIDPSLNEVFNTVSANEPDFIASSGFKSNGTSKWWDTGYNLLNDRVNVANNSCAIFYKGFDFTISGINENICASRASNNNQQLYVAKIAGNFMTRIQDTQTTFPGFPGDQHNDSILVSATNASKSIYRDGSFVVSRNGMSGAGFANLTLPLFGFNSNGSIIEFCSSGLKYFGIGADLGLTNPNTNAVNLHEIMTDIYSP